MSIQVGNQIEHRWLPPSWQAMERETKAQYLCQVHSRRDLAVTLASRLGFEPNNYERFTVGELALIYRELCPSNERPTLGNSRNKLVTQISEAADLSKKPEDRLSVELLAELVVSMTIISR